MACMNTQKHTHNNNNKVNLENIKTQNLQPNKLEGRRVRGNDQRYNDCVLCTIQFLGKKTAKE